METMEPAAASEPRGVLGTGVGERRAAVRFPIEQEVRYKIVKPRSIEVGTGRTINMSSQGVLFTVERPLANGEFMELAIDWPAPLENGCPLKLVTCGPVVRSEQTRAAISIDRYEFRLRGIVRGLNGERPNRPSRPPQS